MLGIEVGDDLLARWRDWLAPAVQPFFVESRRSWPASAGWDGERTLSDELGHTYRTWRVDRSLDVVWLDEATFLDLPASRRAALVREQRRHGRGAVPSVRRWSDLVDPEVMRSQAGGARFVWWPSLVDHDPVGVLSRVIRRSPDGAAPDGVESAHRDVAEATWARAVGGLPDARRIAGAFPNASGPNCFGTVLAAAGRAGAERECVVEAQFLDWLAATARPGRAGTARDDHPGTVLVWRDARTQAPVHAAVTIGDGWTLEKASSEWWTPRAVRRVRDVIGAARARGQRLERHLLV